MAVLPKVPIWDTYYSYRNILITYAIHGTLRYINIVYFSLKLNFFSLLVFDYNFAEMIVKAFEDYVKGQVFFIKVMIQKCYIQIF